MIIFRRNTLIGTDIQANDQIVKNQGRHQQFCEIGFGTNGALIKHAASFRTNSILKWHIKLIRALVLPISIHM